MSRPFYITITADDGTELECRVYAAPPDRAVGIVGWQFEIEPEPYRRLSVSEERRAWQAAQDWRP